MKRHQEETYELAHILANVTEAKLRAEVVTNSPDIQKGAKHFFNTNVINRLNAIITDVKQKFSGEDLEVMKRDGLSEETALQLREVTNIFLSLDKDKRDEVEAVLLALQKEQLSEQNKAA